jgi:hypothetical protein
LIAYYAGDCASAERALALAADEVPDPKKRNRTKLLRGECAYRRADYPAVEQQLHGQRTLTPEQALMLADAELTLGRRDEGARILDQVLRDPNTDRTQRAEAQRIASRHALH